MLELQRAQFVQCVVERRRWDRGRDALRIPLAELVRGSGSALNLRDLGAKQGMERLAGIVRGIVYPLDMPPPLVLLVAPPPICETDDVEFTEMFAGSIPESQKLAPFYAALADQAGCGFFDAGTVAKTTPLDGVHLDAANTRAIGEALAPGRARRCSRL